MENSENNSVMVSQRQKRQKPGKQKKSRIRTAALIFGGVVLIYIICAVFVSLNKNLSTTTALKGTVSEGFRASGYVFRDQNIINADTGGYFEPVVSEGDRVKKDQVIGYVYSEKPDSEIIEQIKSLNSQLQMRGIDGEAAVYTGDMTYAEGQISDAIRTMSDDRINRDLKSVAENKQKIKLMLGDGGENGDSAKSAQQLQSEIDALNNSAGSGRPITAPEGGVFSSRVDGLEDSFGTDKVKEAVPSYLTELDNRQPAEVGQAVCKIINNYTWYFAANVSEKDADTLQKGQTVKMEFFDLTNNAISGTVSRISDAENGRKTVVISTNRYVRGIYSANRVNADLVTVSSEGIKLPVECLRVVDGVTGVYVVRLDAAKFMPVNVKYKNDEWAIVSAVDSTDGEGRLRIYDEVIVNYKTLEDGKIIR